LGAEPGHLTERSEQGSRSARSWVRIASSISRGECSRRRQRAHRRIGRIMWSERRHEATSIRHRANRGGNCSRHFLTIPSRRIWSSVKNNITVSDRGEAAAPRAAPMALMAESASMRRRFTPILRARGSCYRAPILRDGVEDAIKSSSLPAATLHCQCTSSATWREIRNVSH